MNNTFSSKYSLLAKASKTMFISIAIASVIVSFSLVAMNALWSQISFNNKLNSQKEDVLATLKSNKTNLESLKTSFEALELGDDLIVAQGERDNSAVILDALPITIDVPALNTFVQNLALESGVDVESFGSSELELSAEKFMPAPTPQEVPFDLTVVGDYDTVVSFLNILDSVIRPLNVRSIQLDGSDQNLTATMKLITYYQPGVLIEPTLETIQ